MRHLARRIAGAVMASVIMLVAPPSGAVHKGSGSIVCSGCHTMHASLDGVAAPAAPVDKLLKQSSTEVLCLYCHDTTGGGYVAGTTPAVRTAAAQPAGGDFLDLDVVGDLAGSASTGKGHNLGEGANLNINIPGSATNMITGFDCANCHDPHGTGATDDAVLLIDSYRNLRQAPTGAPVAGAQNIICAQEGTVVSGDVYLGSANAYGDIVLGNSGITQWCGKCHQDFHGAGTGDPEPWIRHPQDEDMVEDGGDTDIVWANYNTTTAEANRLPLEDTVPSVTANATNAVNDAAGNEAADAVFCLSCHYAHAGPFEDSLRWDNSVGLANTVGCQQCHLR